MAADKNEKEPKKDKKVSTDESEEEESQVLEESPCGRWLKRKEEIKQRNIPGIDVAYLAMDSEEGVEVVWNEVIFSEKKKFKYQEKKIRDVFDNLILLDHPNIAKFYKYWINNDTEKLKVVFITEYMSSGSLKQFLKKTKRNVIKLPIQAWKRWCTQILSALNYLHSCHYPIVHGNITCDTIFIQHNGLVKIGSVFPDVIYHNVNAYKKDLKSTHFYAPEYSKMFSLPLPPVDIYAFGICALEMAALEICTSSDLGNQITEDIINKTLESLDNALQKDFIKICLRKSPLSRPSARELLFHPVIFEVHSLKLLAAHVVKSASYQPEKLTNEALSSCYNQSDVLAYIPSRDGKEDITISRTNAPKLDLEKFLDDVKNGSYPLIAFPSTYASVANIKFASPHTSESGNSSPGMSESETRKIIKAMCNIKPISDSKNVMMTILLRMDDLMNRQLTSEVSENDTPLSLAEELVAYGLINIEDCNMIATLIEDTLKRRSNLFPEIENNSSEH